ncbi:hypothetical protein FIBSPDRAFT_846680 [Athelia psychrophila]|uniref:Protein kinase domain-containing protein n=1 Tax=Athelia psychrophila TaxID=1759441 RepID=A0A166XA95_9AGAM|nr:hypothetical protein FIBSPDRAFT_846680 [Fibularhizoctonia sp. CBS 109695]
MCFLHRLGIAHLDFHKDNFIHDDAFCWLIDFGESYLFAHDPTQTPIVTGSVMMKPEWGPPETRMPGAVFSPFPLDVYRFGQTLEAAIPAVRPDMRSRTACSLTVFHSNTASMRL